MMTTSEAQAALIARGYDLGKGGPSGKRYDASLNGVINTFGGGANFLPGNAAGTVFREASMREFNPADWYWLADDGRIFASARMTIVAHDDAEYLAWVEGGGLPTTWPRDDAGVQTDAALQDILRPYGLWVDLVAYARDARWRAEVGGMVWNGVPIATDDSSKIKIAGARLAAEANPGFETTWWGMDGEGVVVDAPLIIQLSDAVLAHVDATFTAFGLVRANVGAGTITSREEIDAAFANLKAK